MMPHPFLLPHVTGNYKPEDNVPEADELLDLPIYQNMRIVQSTDVDECHRLVLGRFYVDGVDVGGKARKAKRKV